MNLNEKRKILLYGRTNAGKTAQIGKLAEHIFATTGKRTRLYTADRGGIRTILPYIELGIIEHIPIESTDPWLFLHKTVTGQVRGKDGKWVPGDLSNIGMIANESFRSFAEEILNWEAEKAGEGVNIGGGANISFTVTAEGESLKIGGGNQAHYKVAQDRMMTEIWKSQKLDVPYLLWTSSVSKDEDMVGAGKILGPDVIGKALTGETPRWFDYTLRIDVLPATAAKPERHLLYLGTHVDINAGNAAAVGNIRRPLDSPPLPQIVIEPADIVRALQLVEGGYDPAKEAIRKRLGDKLSTLKQQ